MFLLIDIIKSPFSLGKIDSIISYFMQLTVKSAFTSNAPTFF